jgi:acyl-CoA reductase-like NAD-dependent aldehyde dehydrogenase
VARKPAIPDPLKRRHLVEEDLDPARALAIAEAYLGDGRLCEAVAFLAKAEARERLEALRDEAVAMGDPFLLRQACGALGEEPGARRWQALAEAARAAGKEVQARDAERQAQLGAERGV